MTEPWLREIGRRRRAQPDGACGWEPCGYGCCLWSRELFAIRVADNVVSEEVLRPGEPMEWEAGWDRLRLEDRPWLARDREPWRSSLAYPPSELAEDWSAWPPPVDLRPARERARRPRAPVTKVESRDRRAGRADVAGPDGPVDR